VFIETGLETWRSVCRYFYSYDFAFFFTAEYLCLVTDYLIMALYMSNICRLCMARKDVLIPLFSNDSRGQTVSLPDKIMNFVPVIKVRCCLISVHCI
jgi:hypothetical protein